MILKKTELEPTKAGTFINRAPIIYHEKSFFLFGGKSFDEASAPFGYYAEKRIGRMDLDGQWTEAGRMNQGRYGHNVIYNGVFLMVFGGSSEDYNTELQTERCSVRNGSISCFSQTPDLKNYSFYPELFLVPDNFCK